MNPWIISIALVCGIAIAQSVFLATYMLVKDRLRTRQVLFLSILLFALALRIGKSYFFYVLPEVPHWGVALGGAGLWAIGPSFWLYTRLSSATSIRRADYLHYAPSLAILLGGSFFPISWIVSAYHIGSAIFALYLLASGWMYWKGKWEGNENRFKLFWISMVVICGTFLVQMWSSGIQAYTIGSAITCIVLYGINFIILQDQSILKAVRKSSKKKDEADLQPIAENIDHYFRQERVFLQKGLKLSTVANHLQTPTYLISQAVNQYYGKKFNEFVNAYRVEEVKKHLENLQENKTIEVIAGEVGFSSTASLYQAFKKSENLTPQAYRKRLVATQSVN